MSTAITASQMQSDASAETVDMKFKAARLCQE